MHTNTEQYWRQRYQNHTTTWDIGAPSTPIASYIEQLTNKDIAILIPGCGTGYEVAFLYQQGFTNVTCIDIAAEAIERCKQILPKEHQVKLLQQDFFKHSTTYDLIIEQTFFCALPPSMRKQYVLHMHSILNTKGKIAGLLFNKIFEKEGPPFGGSILEYQQLFSTHFNQLTMQPCYNSIESRAGNELFVIFEKR
jgi:methyl halide transferase